MSDSDAERCFIFRWVDSADYAARHCASRSRFDAYRRLDLELIMGVKSSIWLGRQDSNLGMTESKSVALPLGYAP